MSDVAAAVEAVAETTAASEQTDDIEVKAREQGWRPKDEWTGKPENWKDPQTYIEHSDLKTRLAKAEDRLARVNRTVEKSLKKIERDYEDKLAALKDQKRAAVAKGDVKTVDAIDEKLDELKEERSEKIEATEAKDPAAIKADWVFDNPWFEDDIGMTKYAVSYSQGLPEDLSVEDNLKKTDAAMRKRYPDYDFGSKKPAAKLAGVNGHAPVDGGGAFPGLNKKTGKTASDLPREAKEVGAQFVKQGLYADLNAYAKSYFSEEKKDA